MDAQNEFLKINEKLDSLCHRLFEDNGVECLQSKINRHELWMQNHSKEKENAISLWYFLIPIFVSIGIVVIDKIWN